jgi:hypothetical protein
MVAIVGASLTRIVVVMVVASLARIGVIAKPVTGVSTMSGN